MDKPRKKQIPLLSQVRSYPLPLSSSPLADQTHVSLGHLTVGQAVSVPIFLATALITSYPVTSEYHGGNQWVGSRSTWPVQPPPEAPGHLYDAPPIQSPALLSPSHKAPIKSPDQGDPFSPNPAPPSRPPQGHLSVFQSSAQAVLLVEEGEEGEEKRLGRKRMWHLCSMMSHAGCFRIPQQRTEANNMDSRFTLPLKVCVLGSPEQSALAGK